jgi:hypothetical protein
MSIVVAGLTFAVSARADLRREAPINVDPFELYGDEVRFDVYRDGNKVGFHRVWFGKRGTDLTVENKFRIEIKVLFLTAYSYQYSSEARWRAGQLLQIAAQVDDDGATSQVSAALDDDRMKVNGSAGRYTAEATLYPTNHWNVEVLRQKQVLNTLTGQLNSVRIEAAGRELVATEFGEALATRYAYKGDLETEAWYDDAGRWVKLRFQARDGSTIEYVCRRCQGGSDRNSEK